MIKDVVGLDPNGQANGQGQRSGSTVRVKGRSVPMIQVSVARFNIRVEVDSFRVGSILGGQC